MDKIFDIVNELLTAAVSSGELQEKQILLFILIVAPLALVVWKIRGIIAFINEVRNSKLNELQHLLDGHELPDEVNVCIKNEIKRVIGYRMTGIADVAKQQIIWQLLDRNGHLISADFFKKFRSFLLIKGKVLVFKKGVFYWIENGMYGWLSCQFLLSAVLFIALSIYRCEQIPVWGHLVLYLVSIIMFLFFIAFANFIPRSKECRLLNEILQTQSDNQSE